jgi:hypothetical protein
MNQQQDDYEAIEGFLHDLPDYVVLRNHDFRANLGRGGDVDVLVTDMAAARAGMRKSLGRPWWIMRRTYVEGCFYPWGHIDLTPRMEWHGATYIENSTIFAESSLSSFGFLQPRPAHEALICWFASLIWGGFFKARYAEVIQGAAKTDPEAFRKALIHAVGGFWGNKLFDLAASQTATQSVQWVKPLRRALWLRGFRRNPCQTLVGWGQQWLREIKMRAAPPVPWFAVRGLDDKRRSELLAEIETGLAQLGVRSQVHRWRPGTIKLSLAKQAVDTNPAPLPPGGALSSIIKLAFLGLDWTLGFRIRIADTRARGTFVIFDQYHADLLTDPASFRYGGPMSLARILSALMPQPDAVIHLTSDSGPENRGMTASSLPETRLDPTIRAKDRLVVAADRPNAEVSAEVVEIIRKTTETYSRLRVKKF